MSLVSRRFTTAVPADVADRIERASRNAPPIRIGEPMRGAVRAIQQALLDLEDPRFALGTADGLFGQRTANAVRAFQQAYRLAVDGSVGAQTMGKLDELYSPEVIGGTKGISLHFGLNAVDPNHYQGWDGALGGCEPDARDMKAIADSQGFASKMILTAAATSGRLLSELRMAAETLTAGDILMLTYSGHGGQVPNSNGDDESDQMDETWCMFDREVVDDELYSAFARFTPGVRILVFSDSCHSGTVTRAAEFERTTRAAPGGEGAIKPRVLPAQIAERTYQANQGLYDALQANLPPFERADVRATVLLLSGCQDHQLSGDTGTNGVFTNAVKKIWNNGQFNGSYRTFHGQIRSIMPLHQQPNFFDYGAPNGGFLSQRPFAI